MEKILSNLSKLIKCNFLALVLCFFLFSKVNAQDSKGTDFWLMFPTQYSAPTLTLFITSEVNTSGTISGSSFASIPFSVTANTVTSVVVPVGLQSHTSDVVDNKGVHVTALQEITVYGLNRAVSTTDAYLGLPTDALGNIYRIMTYQNVGVVNGTAFGIVGTVNGTVVTIIPSVTTGARTAGVPYNIALNQGEAYYLEHSETSTGDLTGTLLNSTQPIGVFGSHRCANIPTGCFYCDHIVEMLPPTSTYGKKFGAVPLGGRDGSGDQWKFLASDNGTTISIDGVVQAPVLNAGQVMERSISTKSVIESDKPILVAQFAKGITCSGNITGDPFMMMIPSFEQYLSNYTMTTVSGFTTHYINIVAPNAVVSTLTLNGVAIPAGSYTAIGASGFSGAVISVTAGSHVLNATSPFGATIYGWNAFDSYGYGGGQSFSPVAIVSTLDLTSATGTAGINTNQCWQTVVQDQFNNPLENIRVDYTVTGVNPQTGFSFTNASGISTFCFTGSNPGIDNITANVGTLDDDAEFTWTSCLTPTITCPVNITGNNDPGVCGANVSFAATATGTSPTITYSPASGSLFPVGTTTVTATATNDCGTASCTFTVTVIDNEPPVITCPAPITINTSPGLCTGTTTLIPPVVTDNCNSFGNALSFAGGYVNVPNAPILNPFNEWTLETWVKRINTGVQESLIEKYIEPASTYGYLLRILSSNKAQAGFVFGSFAGYFIVGTTTILPNTWYHLATTVNRTTGVMKLYVNGVLDAQVTGMTGLPAIPNTASLKLGARGDDAATRLSNGGLMDEVRVWNVERTQAQIQLSMNSELGAQPGLVALYHFNQGIAGGNNTGLTTATDASGNGNNGSLISFALTGPTSNWVNRQGSGPTVTNNAPTTYPIGNTTVTWTATDASGNAATCTQVVTVIDNQPPVFIGAATFNVYNGFYQYNGTQDKSILDAQIASQTLISHKRPTCMESFNDNTGGTNHGYHISVPFTEATATNFSFRVGPDFGGGGAVFLDGQYVVSKNYDLWWGGNWSNTSQLLDGYNIPVTAGPHVLEIYGWEGCCFGGMSLQIDLTSDGIWDCAGGLPTVTGECSATVTAPTAMDNCAGTVTGTTPDPTTYNGQGTFTVHWTFNDGNGNSSSVDQTVIVKDITPPVITLCAANKTSASDAGLCTKTFTAAQIGTPIVTDNCGTPTITWSRSDAASNLTDPFPFGTTTITWTATDGALLTATCNQTINIDNVTTTTSVTVTPSTQQYSDKVTFVATVTPCGCGSLPAIGGLVTFKVGTQTMGTAAIVCGINGIGTATLSNVALLEPTPFGTAPTGQMAPGTKTVTASYSGAGAYLASNSTATDNLTITCEDARAYYTGACYVSTSSPTSNNATITLSATIKDISATLDAAGDVSPGDIRNATVTFINRETNTIIVANRPVGLVNPGDPTVGTATFNWNTTITGDAQLFTIGIIVNNYYCRDNSDDNTVVTVAKPLGDLFITGGGYLVLTNSAGIKAGTLGTKNNFGFNVKYNKSKTNLQGNMNIIIRRLETDGMHVYQVKGNVMTSLVVNTDCPKTATFNGKANITDITNQLAPVPIDGNATLQVKMTDMGEPGSSDKIAITVWNKSGGMWFASNWNGTTTIEQLLGGGNLKVHGGTPCTTSPSTTQTVTNTNMEVKPEPTLFNVKAYPNPSEHQFTLVVEGGSNEKVQLVVYDVLGRTVKKIERGDGQSPIRFGEELLAGAYIVEVRQGVNRKTIKLVKQ